MLAGPDASSSTGDEVAIVVSLIALAGSGIGFWINRHHARKLFASSHFADFDFRLRLMTPEMGMDAPPYTFKNTISIPYYTFFLLNWQNKTQQTATDLYCVCSVTHRLRRVCWDHRPLDWQKIKEFQEDQDLIGRPLNGAMAKVCPKSLILEGDYESNHSSLTLRPGKSEPSVGLVLEFRWRAPVFRSKVLKRRFRGRVRLREGEAGRIVSCETTSGRLATLSTLINRRPRTTRLGRMLF
jgi:hypothetical protein